jgi:hypothetical protein
MKFILFKVEHRDWSVELMTAPAHTLYDLAEAIIQAIEDPGHHRHVARPVSTLRGLNLSRI